MKESEARDIDGALDALDAGDLRELIRALLAELDGPSRERAVDRLVARAAGKGAGWAPKAPGEEVVAAIVAFAQTAKQGG